MAGSLRRTQSSQFGDWSSELEKSKTHEGAGPCAYPSPGMTILKIVAWDNRHNELPTKNAEDLALILNHYAEAGNSERLHEEHPDFITDVEGDMELAGTRLLGNDMKFIMGHTTKQVVQNILTYNTIPESSDRLVEAIFRDVPGQSYERALGLLQNLQKGLGDNLKFVIVKHTALNNK